MAILARVVDQHRHWSWKSWPGSPHLNKYLPFQSDRAGSLPAVIGGRKEKMRLELW